MGGGARETAGAKLLRRRNRHTRRCGVGDAPRGGGGIRRLGDFQVVRSGSSRQGDREGGQELQGSGKAVGGEPRIRRGYARARDLQNGGVGVDADAGLVVDIRWLENEKSRRTFVAG